MLNITENDIMKWWNRDLYKEPIVTIRCLAYNHELYIANAIEGFLIQQTEYPFEVYIHEDCSSDNTADIIRMYEQKFPNILKVVYEPENLWSKHDDSMKKVHSKYCIRKYQAECEGDDYWTDPQKLQKQLKYMEEHEDCSLTFTNGSILNVKSGQIMDVFLLEEIKDSLKNQIITLDNFYILKYPPTASHIFRRELLSDVDEVMSPCQASDLRNRLYLLTKGYAYYFSDKTCIYRTNVQESVTTKWKHYDKRQQIKELNSYIKMFTEINVLTNFRYRRSIWEIEKIYFQKLIACEWFYGSFKMEKKKAYSELSIGMKIKTILKYLTPNYLYSKLKS